MEIINFLSNIKQYIRFHLNAMSVNTSKYIEKYISPEVLVLYFGLKLCLRPNFPQKHYKVFYQSQTIYFCYL